MKILILIISIFFTGFGFSAVISGSIPGALLVLTGWIGILFHVYINNSEK